MKRGPSEKSPKKGGLPFPFEDLESDAMYSGYLNPVLHQNFRRIAREKRKKEIDHE